MAYSNPTPPISVPSPSTGGNVDIKPGPMPPIVQPPSPTVRRRFGGYDPAMIAEIMARRREAMRRLQPILGGGRGVPKNELPPPTTRGERGGGKFMDGRGQPGVSYPDYYGPRMPELIDGRGRPGGFPEGRGFPSHGDTGFMNPEQRDAFARFVNGRNGGAEAMPMPAQITPEMVQRWWNGGGQRPVDGNRGAESPVVPPPTQAMLPDQGVNQAPSRPRRPQRPPANNAANAQAFNESLFTQGGFAAGLPHDLKVLISEAYATGDNTTMNQAIWNDPTIPNDIKYQLSNLGAVGTGGNVMSDEELADILSRLRIQANPYYGGF